MINTIPHERKRMIFETVVVGPLQVNCYILGCEQSREGIVIDPGGDADKIIAAFSMHKLRILHVLNTHGHFDHVSANRDILEATGTDLLIHEADAPILSMAAVSASVYGLQAEDSPAPDHYLLDGMIIHFGSYTLRVLHTPGHTPGGCCFLLDDLLISGDTLFADSVGRTDFPGGSMEALLTSIHGKLLALPDNTTVFPGHGPSTTIGRERKFNPYLQGR